MTKVQCFRADGSEILLHDTEDKDWWITYGEDKERAFEVFCRRKNILPGLTQNPERITGKKRGAPEFILGGFHLDLKVQHQPFFEAEQRFGIPPRYAVTLNWQDVNDVRQKYSDCITIYWVNWVPTHYLKTAERKTMPPRVLADITIQPLHGVWRLDPAQMFLLEDDAIKRGNLHWYQRRQGDKKGNAKSSYVIDIREMELMWLDLSIAPIESIT